MYGVQRPGLGERSYYSASANQTHQDLVPKVFEFKIENFKSDRHVLDGVCSQLLLSIKSVCMEQPFMEQPLLEEMFAQVSIDPIQNIEEKLKDLRIGNISRICLSRSLPDVIERSDLLTDDKRLFLELFKQYT